MTDIIRRLLIKSAATEDYDLAIVCDEAADEIERLRGILQGVECALARDENIDAAMRLIIRSRAALTNDKPSEAT